MEEYRTLLQSKGALMTLVLTVMVYSFLYPAPYLNEVLRDVPLAVVDCDHSALSRQLSRMLDATEHIRVAAKPGSLVEAKAAFFRNEISGILVIPENFQRDVRRNERVMVAAYYDTSNMYIFRQLRSGVTFATRTLSAGIQGKTISSRRPTGQTGIGPARSAASAHRAAF